MDAVARLAAHVVGATYERLPAAAREAAKTFLLDSIGVAIAGGSEPWMAGLLDAAAGWGEGAGATVWGTRRRLPAASAALVNACQIHALEFDCVHEGAVVHPMATLLPALLATAERRGGVTGRDLLIAIVVGVDVSCALGVAARGPMRFFRPATAGAFGATAALARLAGFDADALTSALGIVYGQVSGTLQAHVEGSPVLALQMGVNARAAITAVDLAATGLPAPRDVLEGQYGYLRLFEDAYDLDPVLADLGAVWRVTQLAHKPFPSGRLTHGVVDGLQQLQAAHGFGAEEVVAVNVRVPPLVARLVGRPAIVAPAPSYARLCLPFVAATALLRGTVDVPDFRGERLTEARTHALARKVEIVADENPDENALVPQTVIVALAGGRRLEIKLERVLGHPDRPLSRAQHLAKLRRCWSYGASRLATGTADELIRLVDRLEAVADVRELLALTVP
jgi:2-methylcitrate dehydratase PrpD